MWPIQYSELRDAIADGATPLAPAGATARPIQRALAWSEPSMGPHDAFFALDAALHALVPAALAAGTVCVVRAGFAGIGRLPAEAHDRVFVTANPLRAYRQLAAFVRRRFTFPVVAVGGSNGKTTTKEMIATIVASGGGRVTATPGTNNGWVGVPITLCHPGHRDPAPDALVVEIGIDELGSMAHHVALAEPDIAVLTALGVEHLAGLKNHPNVIAEELALFAGSKRRIWLASDPALREHIGDARPGDVVVHQPADGIVPREDIEHLAYAWREASPTSGSLSLRWNGRTADAYLPLPGAHNGRNAALAVAAALLLGGELDATAAALATLRGPAQRCRVSELPSGCVLIDDTYNASPASVDAALDVLAAFDPSRPRLIVLGDMLDLGEETAECHRSILPKLAAVRGAHVRLYGEEATKLRSDIDLAASVGCAARSDDPADLVDVGALDDMIVLLKGSRGMALERAVARVQVLAGGPWNAEAIGVFIVGPGAGAFAAATRAAIAARRFAQAIFVRALSLADLEGGIAARRPYDVAVVTALSIATAEDVERDLAAIAQLAIHLRPGGVLVLPDLANRNLHATDDSRKDLEGAEDAVALLAGVLPPHAALRSARAADAISLVISEIETRIDTDAPKFATGATSKVL